MLSLAPGWFRLPYGTAPGPFARDAPREAGPDPLDGSGDPGALREEPGLDLLADEAQAVADVGAQGRPVVAVVEIVVAAVRARAGEGDANEGGVELWADAAFGRGVEGLDPERPGRVPFLHAPTSRIEIGVRRDGIPAAVKQRGREAGFRVGVPVPDEPDAQGPRAQRGLVPGCVEDDGPVALAGGENGVEPGVGTVPDAEHEVQFALPVGESPGEGGGAAVVDDDVAFGRRAEVHEGGGPLVLGVEPIEVDRDAVADPVEGADHALGVVGTVDDAVAVLREFPGQGDLRTVDGEGPGALPERAFGTVGEDLRVQALERGLV